MSNLSEIVKTCSCGKSYTQEKWSELKQLPAWNMGLEYYLDLRNCSCGSTMAVNYAKQQFRKALKCHVSQK